LQLTCLLLCAVQYIIAADQCQYAALMQTKAARLSLKSMTRSNDANIAAVVLVTFLIVLISALLAWIVYAYRNPNSQSGIWLIQVCQSSLIMLSICVTEIYRLEQ